MRIGHSLITEESATEAWPAEVDLILSALEAGAGRGLERRRAPRTPYRVRALLQLHSDAVGTPAWVLYTRDVNERGVGFISPHRLPLGYGGIVEIQSPDGQLHQLACTLFRCREAAPGWFEGALYFNRPQIAFGNAG